MDTIISYLNNMFARLPDTADMRRVKDELLATMEDKFNALTAQGKSEHEAIGIVISEFGNIEELVGEMNVAEIKNNESSSEKTEEALPVVEAAAVEEYIAENKKAARMTAVGTLLCILSPILLIYFTWQNNESAQAVMFGMIPLILLVAGAVSLFIMMGLRMERYEYIEKPHLLPEYVKIDVQNQQDRFAPTRIVCTVLGVAVIILGTLPVIIAAVMEMEVVILYGVCVLLAMVAIGVFMLVWSNMIYDGYNKLLGKQEYSIKAQKNNKIVDAVGGIYWMLVTAAYLAWSFIGNAWGRSWIIWPIAGVTFGGIAALISALTGQEK